MKILAFESAEIMGGGEKVFEKVVNYLKEKHNIYIVVGTKSAFTERWSLKDLPTFIVEKGRYSLYRKNLRDVSKYMLKSLPIIAKYRSIVSKVDPDVLYVNSLQLAPWVSILSRLMGIPTIIHAHIVLRDKKALELLNLSFSLKTVRKILCVAQRVCSQFNISSSKKTIVYNGVDISVFSPPREKGQYKEAIGFDSGRILIGNIGAIIPTKGQVFLLDVIKGIKMDFTAVFVGGNVEGFEDYYRDFIASMDGLDRDRVIYFGYRQDIPDIMKAFDFLVVSSVKDFEACPMVVLEAMATGIPVIAPRLGGIPEIIEDGENGFLYNPRDREDLKEKINILIENEPLRYEMGRRAREDAVNKFSLEKQLKRIEEIFEEVLR